MDIERLFTPFSIGAVTVRNRLVMSPMQRHRPERFIPGVEQAGYYRERVRGGVGLIVTQGTTMDHRTTESPYARLYPPAYDGWRRCVDAVRAEGGQIVMQLWHEGAFRPGGYGPSGLNAAGEAMGQALSREEIPEIVELYARSARTAEQLGFTGVEMHYGQGYLLGQFLSPVSNRRDDDYGGDAAGRMRLGLEAVAAARALTGPDFLVGLRASASRPDRPPRLFGSSEALKGFLTAMQGAGATHFHAFAARFWDAEFPDTGSDLGLGGWMKAHTGAPVIAGGSVGVDDVLMTTLTGGEVRHENNFGELLRRLERGDFDLVSIGRTILTDPQWPTKLREGRLHDMLQQIPASAVVTSPAAIRPAPARA